MVQLVFEAGDASEALSQEPVSVGYSQHEGGEAASWDDEKLEPSTGATRRSPGRAPTPTSSTKRSTSAARRSRASAATRGLHTELRPTVKTIPSDAAAARRRFRGSASRGGGEPQEAFFNGPTGPNEKLQWTEPIVWSEEWRGPAYGVPTGGVLGTSATDFFCEAVGAGTGG